MPTLDVGDLGLELQDVALELQSEVAAGVGDDIVLVWRTGQSSTPVPGGVGTGKYGTKLTTGGESARPDQKAQLVGVYYARRGHNAGGNPQDFGGQMVDVLPWIFTLNEAQDPDISGGDVLTLAVKREASETLDELGWQPQTVYEEDSEEMPANLSLLIAPNKRRKYRATKAGVSGLVEPVWPSTFGASVADGTIVWEDAGLLDSYEVKDPGGRDTIPVERVVGCIEVQS
jgi:hypothetical protein